MKKLTTTMLCALVVACVLVSCAKEAPEVIATPTPTPTEELATPTTTPAPEETPEETPEPVTGFISEITDLIHAETIEMPNGYSLVVTGFYPQTGIESIDNFYRERCESFKSEAKDFADEISFYDEADSFITQFMLEYDYEVIKNSDNILSVHRTVYSYTGGAHGNNGDVCDNFRISDGKTLTLDDIFDCSSEEYQADLCRIFDKFIDENTYEIDSDDFSKIPFFNDAKETLRSYFPMDEFCITDDGLIFFISPYYIAPYVAGTVILPVSWNDLTVARAEI